MAYLLIMHSRKSLPIDLFPWGFLTRILLCFQLKTAADCVFMLNVRMFLSVHETTQQRTTSTKQAMGYTTLNASFTLSPSLSKPAMEEGKDSRMEELQERMFLWGQGFEQGEKCLGSFRVKWAHAAKENRTILSCTGHASRVSHCINRFFSRIIDRTLCLQEIA
jgi:hypothetical protein